MAGRSPERQAEVAVMDSIERAMRRIDELTPAAAARVRRWVGEVYPPPQQADGAAPQAGDST